MQQCIQCGHESLQIPKGACEEGLRKRSGSGPDSVYRRLQCLVSRALITRTLLLLLCCFVTPDCRRSVYHHEEYWDEKRTKLRERGEWIWAKDDSGQEMLLQHGLWQSWYRNGQLRSQVRFDKGKPIGVYKHWHENGQLAQTVPYDAAGLPHGTIRWWNKDGKLVRSSEMTHGTGIAYFFYPDGRLKTIMSFVKGKPEGKATYFSKDGRVEKIIEFRGGQRMMSQGGRGQ